MQFNDIAINIDFKKYLIDLVNKKKIPSVILLYNTDNTSNLHIAIAYSQYICCINKSTYDSCGKCISCYQYNQLIYPDLYFSYPFISHKSNKYNNALFFLEKWKNLFLKNYYLSSKDWFNIITNNYKKPIITISECHNIIKNINYKPLKSIYNIYIIWLPEYMYDNGNILLKALERIFSYSIIFLIPESIDKILPTIVSRAMLIKVPNLTKNELLIFLKKNYTNNINDIYEISKGNITYAISLINKNYLNHFSLFKQWMRSCFKCKFKSIIELLEIFLQKDKNYFIDFLIYSLNVFKACCTYKVYNILPNKCLFLDKNFVSNFSLLVSFENYVKFINIIEEAIYDIKHNTNMRITFIHISIMISNIIKLC